MKNILESGTLVYISSRWISKVMHDFKGWGRRNKKNLIGYRLNINGDLVG